MDIAAIVAAAGVVESAVANTERSASCKRIRSDLRPLLRAGRARRRRCWRPAAALARTEIIQRRISTRAACDDDVCPYCQARIRKVTCSVPGNPTRHTHQHRTGSINHGVVGTEVATTTLA